MDKALILMTRVPLPGKTKTRLQTHLTAEQCAALHTCFIKDIYSTAAKTEADIFVYYTPKKHKSIMKGIFEEDVFLYHQQGDGLGERMYNAILECLLKGYKKCVLIGTDIPAIKSETINEAFIALDNSDVVIGPTLDGGYYLIGMNRPMPDVFCNTFYGTGTVYESTTKNMKAVGINYSTVSPWYDIDTFDDLRYLINKIKEGEGNIPIKTLMFLMQSGIYYMDEKEEQVPYGKTVR